MTTNIIDFWKANPNYWITSPSKYKEVDEIISKLFWNYNWPNDNLIGQIIYLDQFSRHFERIGYISELHLEIYRNQAIDLIKDNLYKLISMDEIEIIFALMPFKHLKLYDFIFEYLHNTWLPESSKKLIDFPQLQKFYIDTYKKAFTLDIVEKNIITKHNLEPYSASLICDYYPHKYVSSDWNIDSYQAVKDEKLLDLLNFDKKVTISLSGGVDSMVLLTLLKHKGVDVEAVHIIYGNRNESVHEYRLLAEFCNRLDVKLYVYKIQWLKRGEIDRQFYEDMTRNLRFAVYHAVSEGEPNIILGHIKDDIVENIWSNIAHCHHLENLKKMEEEELQLGVRIIRPFLTAEKADIYRVSQLLAIPYFKNTTPSWSNRGKFREHFYQATIEQYGEGIDTKLIEFADAIQSQNKLLNILLYDPIYKSFKDNTVNITTAFNTKIDANSWLIIYEHICHKFIGCSRPHIKSVREFTIRLYKPWTHFNITVSKGLKIQIIKNKDSQYIMEFIIL